MWGFICENSNKPVKGASQYRQAGLAMTFNSLILLRASLSALIVALMTFGQVKLKSRPQPTWELKVVILGRLYVMFGLLHRSDLVAAEYRNRPKHR